MNLETVTGFADFMKANWSSAVHAITALSTSAAATGPGREALPFDQVQQLGRMYEQSANGEVAGSMIVAAHDGWDVRSLLGVVRTPTLILHVIGDTLFSFNAAQQMAERIKESTLIPLHDLLFQEGEALSVVDRFLPAVRPSGPSSKGHDPFRTVLFTDLVGHTEMMSRLGDEGGRAVLREHELITREVLKAHGGTEVKTMGDGFMASFGSVTRAVECAVALQKALDEWNAGVGAQQGAPLRVRCGLNAGEPIEEEGDLFGTTVILAARIAAKAEGGEILVANAVRELCAGKGFLFADRGEFVAKGFEDPVRVYEVRWRD